MSISLLPPRIFRPLASSGETTGLARLADAARLPHPGHDPDAAVLEQLRPLLADRRVLPAQALLVARDQRRHQAEVRLGHLAAAVGDRQHRHVERALAQRAELRERLDQRARRVDLDLERSVGALLDVGRELARELVAEIAVGAGRRGELVRDLEHARLLCGGGRSESEREHGERTTARGARARARRRERCRHGLLLDRGCGGKHSTACGRPVSDAPGADACGTAQRTSHAAPQPGT